MLETTIVAAVSADGISKEIVYNTTKNIKTEKKQMQKNCFLFFFI